MLFCEETRAAAGASQTGLYYVAMAGEPEPERLVREPMDDVWCMGAVSPDGEWLAYVSTEDSTNVYVRRFRGSGAPLRISEGNGYQPVWSR